MKEQSKDWYISKISEMSDRYGDLLVKCMDYYKKNNLATLTLEELKYFYESLNYKR